MTTQEFIDKYNNQPVEVVDPTNRNQCFDLVVKYCMEVLGLPITIFGGLTYAYQIWSPSTKMAVENFDYIENSTTANPIEGDIVVWSHWYNFSWNFWGAGHTGVATGKGVAEGKSSDWFECFEQNDPTGTYSHLRIYNYNNVVGWLRKKSPKLTDSQKIVLINSTIETQISDTQFRNFTREILKK